MQIFLHAGSRNRETGVQYNMSARDGAGPPEGAVTGRLRRARDNLLETLPLLAAAVLTAHAAGREGTATAYAAWTYLGARVVYVPLYAFGVPGLRSVAWGVGIAALVTYFWVVLHP